MRINPPSLHFLLSPSLPHFPPSLFHRVLSVPPPHLEGHPICFLLGVHFQSAGWWNSEFRPPSSDERSWGCWRSLGAVPATSPSLPVPHLPLCNNMLKPTSVFNSMFIWTALGKWKLSLKTGGLKATAWIQTTLFDQQRNMYMCIKRAFISKLEVFHWRSVYCWFRMRQYI